ncbi:MAG TPA: BON domain-containing protein [Burkholderiaceae bacterium]|jgi:osmotically-inducible protein OsmY|nr:BON domain-containing protein [Burkholderiaceae bacterium]
MKRTIGWVVAAGLAATLLDGCVVPVLVGGAAVGGAVVATDRRDVGVQLEDGRIESRVNAALVDNIPKTAMNINVTSYNGRVLLAGQVKTAEQRALAEQVAAKVENVREVVNELTVGEPASLGDRTDDTLLAGKVKTALLSADGVPSGVVKTTVEEGVVYLLGKVTPAEADAAAKAASRVGGVRRVVKLFELISDQDVAAIKKKQAESPNSAKDEAHR